MTTNNTLRVLAATAVLALATGGAARADVAEAEAALRQGLQDLVALPNGPKGAIAQVQRGSQLKVFRAGVSNIANHAAMGPHRHMRLASVAKAFSGAAALALVDKGVMSLDDTIGETLPGMPAAWSAITLRQLLGHTSGLHDFTRSRQFQRAVGANLLTPQSPEQLVAYVANRPLRYTPGTKYHYSNTDNILVGLMVRAATNSAYPNVLTREVYRPLGLNDTSLPTGAELPSPYIHGYDNAGEEPPEDVSQQLAAGWTWASGGVVSTPGDLNRFIRGYVGGALFGGATQAAQRDVIVGGRSEPQGPGDNSAGLALFRYETACGTVWGHTGNIPGYTQFAAASSDGALSVTVSINMQYTDAILDDLRRVEELAVCAAFAE